ncbi:MAG TPA: hypothetical protein VMF06_24495 [Candidatus Limnocylindria bacterium]|jgi:hypothetical protein|nr:hypothetical protein [Candidatus Limnocylindria bacterium]
MGLWYWENRRGEQAWEALKLEYAAKGQPIEFEKWSRARGEIRFDNSNFFATPFLRPLFSFLSSTNVDRDDFFGPGFEEYAPFRQVALPEVFGDKAFEAEVDLSSWDSVLGSAERPSQDPRSSSQVAIDLLEKLSKWITILDELEAASFRPEHRVPLRNYDELTRLEYAGGFLDRVSDLLAIRCTARLETGEIDLALCDFETNERLARILLDDPVTGNRITGVQVWERGTRMIWEGLERHRWNADQLKLLASRVAGRNPRRLWLDGMRCEQAQIAEQMNDRMELAMINYPGSESIGTILADSRTSLQELVRDVIDGNLTLLSFCSEGWVLAGEGGVRVARKCVWEVLAVTPGWQRRNTIAEIREMDRYHEAWKSWAQGAEITVEMLDNSEPESTCSPLNPYHNRLLCKTFAWESAACAFINSENRNRMALIACALEDWHLQNGAFPPQLSDLRRGAVPVLLSDAYMYRSFRYELVESGGFSLRVDGILKDKEFDVLKWPRPGDKYAWGTGVGRTAYVH